MAALTAMMGQGSSKGPDPLSADEPARMFSQELKNMSDEEREALFKKAYDRLKTSFAKFSKPDGSKTNPAKTCKDLKAAYPTKPTGNYWIDPNGNEMNDAIMVHCNMATGSSCVHPKPATSKEISISSGEKEMWVGDIPDEPFDINYKADSNQMNFLQMVSTRAEQTIIFHCKQTIAFRNSQGRARKAIALMAWNDVEIRHRGRAKYKVLQDDCQYTKSSWAQSIFQVETSKPARLPIVDLKVEDFGESGQAFKVEFGPVCFS
jgi:collagen type II alpha